MLHIIICGIFLFTNYATIYIITGIKSILGGIYLKNPYLNQLLMSIGIYSKPKSDNVKVDRYINELEKDIVINDEDVNDKEVVTILLSRIDKNIFIIKNVLLCFFVLAIISIIIGLLATTNFFF